MKYFPTKYIKHYKHPKTETQKLQHIFSTHLLTTYIQKNQLTSSLPLNMSSSTNYQRQHVTNADLFDAPEQSSHIDRIQQQFGCSMEAAQMAYDGFNLYIPHCWVGTKTRDDGSLKGECLVYGVMRNLGLGFLTKSTDGKKAINIKLIQGRHGNKDHQSCLIKFDRLFTRGEENAGNIAILEHLLKDPIQNNGKTIHNHLQVEYQDAGPNRYTGKEEPARFWKVYLWRDQPVMAPAPATAVSPRSPKVKFSLVSASDASPRPDRSNAVSPPGSPAPEL